MTTIGTFLHQATEQLRAHSIDSARLDCLLLLEDALRKDRALILAHLDIPLSNEQLNVLNKKVTQRMQHVPLAYIRGKAEFYGHTFMVTTQTLVPRPETEEIVTMVREATPPSSQLSIADIGTGSGCLGVSLGIALPESTIYVCDIDAEALQVAARNAKTYRVRAHIIQSDLFKGCPADMFDMVVANLPYVPDDYPINAAAAYEPEHALFSGHDGLDLYQEFWRQLQEMVKRPTSVYTESLPWQHESMAKLAAHAGYRLRATRGLIQAFAR